jgi:DNA invertase Pin-like site-specific DNA recombinase
MQEVQRPLLTPDECQRMPGPQKDEHDRITAAGDMVIYCAGHPAIYGRDLISERTREGLASARAKGRLLGRPKGVLGKSRLDGKEEEIRLLLQKQVSKASIAKIVGVTRPTIHRFIKTRRLRPHP